MVGFCSTPGIGCFTIRLFAKIARCLLSLRRDPFVLDDAANDGVCASDLA